MFFAFSAIIMPGLRELPPAQAIPAMRAFNRTAVRPPLMLLMFATAVLCAILIVRSAMRWGSTATPWTLAAAIAFLLAAVVITGMSNVPTSAAIDNLDPSATNAAAKWAKLFTSWDWWNHARTLTATAAAVGFAFALRPNRT